MKLSTFSLAFLSFLNLCPASAQTNYVAPITLQEVYFIKQFEPEGDLSLVAYPLLKQLCLGFGNRISYGSYSAAQHIESLANGAYYCAGEFVKVPNQSEVQVFSIRQCITQDPEDLRKSCKQFE